MYKILIQALFFIVLLVPVIIHAQDIEFIEGPIEGMYFVNIPAGSFLMGSPSNEAGRLENEGPQHMVYLDSFEIMATEVSQETWEIVMGTSALDMKNLSEFPDMREVIQSDAPMFYLNYYDCLEFIETINELDSLYIYRLPSEAEWEYACRAGTTTPYYWGTEISQPNANQYCWYDRNAQNHNVHSFAQLSPNEWGLYDMSGNVWEWCADWWNDSYNNWSGAPSDGSAWTEGNFSDIHILRGGSTANAIAHCRSAVRNGIANDERHNTTGFRLVRIAANIVNAERFINEGSISYRNNEYTQAISYYSSAIELDPVNSWAFTSRGYAYLGLENYYMAMSDFSRAIELDPVNSWAFTNRGLAYLGLENYDLAISDCSRAIELDPMNSVAFTNRGLAYVRLENYDLAISDCSRAIELDPANSWALTPRGLAYLEIRNFDLAIADFSEAIELNPDDYNALYNIACYYALLNEPLQSIQYLEQAVSVGLSDLNWIESDTDFDLVRNTSVFSEGMDRIRTILENP